MNLGGETITRGDLTSSRPLQKDVYSQIATVGDTLADDRFVPESSQIAEGGVGTSLKGQKRTCHYSPSDSARHPCGASHMPRC
jgi:hypothetical protein